MRPEAKPARSAAWTEAKERARDGSATSCRATGTNPSNPFFERDRPGREGQTTLCPQRRERPVTRAQKEGIPKGNPGFPLAKAQDSSPPGVFMIVPGRWAAARPGTPFHGRMRRSTSSVRPMRASTRCPTTRSRRGGSRSTGCGCTTSTRARATRSCYCTASVVAPDLIGFGRSDKPTDVGWYSYDGHVASIERLVDVLGLERITLVVHDWGGPIGLRFAVEHEALVERLVILDTGIAGGKPPGERWLRFRDVVREVGGALDIGRLVEAGTVDGLSDDVRAAYDAPFPTPESKAGPRAFPELVATEPAHPSTEPMNRVRNALRAWHKPALVVWGAEDSVLSPTIAARFVELIPGARGPLLLAGASHFLQEDRPVEVTAAIAGFLAEH